MTTSSRHAAGVLWRRLDAPGHDTAIVVEGTAAIELLGMAVFQDEGGPTALHYRVRCDARWQMTEAHVRGWHGARPVELRIVRDEAGHWRLNGAAHPAVSGCVDLDLSFTPATNLLPLRRSSPAVSRMIEVRSAWLEWPAVTLTPLVQRYDRRSDAVYRYESDLPGRGTYTNILRTDAFGWVIDYPGLWAADGT